MGELGSFKQALARLHAFQLALSKYLEYLESQAAARKVNHNRLQPARDVAALENTHIVPALLYKQLLPGHRGIWQALQALETYEALYVTEMLPNTHAVTLSQLCFPDPIGMYCHAPGNGVSFVYLWRVGVPMDKAAHSEARRRVIALIPVKLTRAARGLFKDKFELCKRMPTGKLQHLHIAPVATSYYGIHLHPPSFLPSCSR